MTANIAMGAICDRATKVWNMPNGNFTKFTAVASLVSILAIAMVGFLAQSNFGRLDERIKAQSIQQARDMETLKAELSRFRERQDATIAELVTRQDKLRETVSDLNAEVQGYRSLPSQIVTHGKALEHTRAQLNMILYRVMGKQRVRSEDVYTDGD